MGVVQAGDDRSALQIDALGAAARKPPQVGLVTDADDATVADGHSGGLRLRAVQRVDARVVQDQVGGGGEDTRHGATFSLTAAAASPAPARDPRLR